MKREKMLQNELLLKEEYSQQLNNIHRNRRKILRSKRQIHFQDYNLVSLKKIYHIEINPSSANINFITLPETYNTKILHTHNLKIYYKGKLIEPLESSNEELLEINHLYQIYLLNFIYDKIVGCFKNIEQLNLSIKEIENLNTLKERFIQHGKELKKFYSKEYSLFINGKIPHKYNENEFIRSEYELNKQRKNVEKYFLKKNYDVLNYIADLNRWIRIFIESRYEQLVAIELPEEDLQIKDKFHRTITIETEEPYLGCALIRKRYKNIFCGESAEFLMKIPQSEDASTYYEVYPPEKTRISKVRSSSEDISNCNILMLDFNNPINTDLELNFEEKFDERFVLHIPRENSNKNIPNFYISLKPLKMAQRWVSLSLLLGFFGFLFMLFLYINNFCRWINIDIAPFKDALKYIIPLIYGLIIGNNLWYQKPQFLWKNTTTFSILIIILGIFSYSLILSIH